jgi:hypothetical protein
VADPKDDPAYIAIPALRATVFSSLAAGATVLGGAAIGVAKAAGADIPVPVTVAALGVVAFGLLAIALIVAADLRCRAAVKVATIERGALPQRAASPEGSPLVEVNVLRREDGDGTSVQTPPAPPAEPPDSAKAPQAPPAAG